MKRILSSVPCCGFMGLASLFFAIPSPRRHIPNNRLGVIAHCHVLNRDFLLSTEHGLRPRLSFLPLNSQSILVVFPDQFDLSSW